MEGQSVVFRPRTNPPRGLCFLETTLLWESPKRSAVIRRTHRRTHPIMLAGTHPRELNRARGHRRNPSG